MNRYRWIASTQRGHYNMLASFQCHLWVAGACVGGIAYVEKTCLPRFVVTSPSTPPGYSLRVSSLYCSLPGKKRNPSPSLPAVMDDNSMAGLGSIVRSWSAPRYRVVVGSYGGEPLPMANTWYPGPSDA